VTARKTTQRPGVVDRVARAEVLRLRRALKVLIVEAGTRGWIDAGQARTALRILGLRHE
jgi:hypothetical protein